MPNFTRVKLDTTLGDLTSLRKRLNKLGIDMTFSVEITTGMDRTDAQVTVWKGKRTTSVLTCDAYMDFRNNLRRIYLILNERCKLLASKEIKNGELFNHMYLSITKRYIEGGEENGKGVG